MSSYALKPIGFIRSAVNGRGDAPRQGREPFGTTKTKMSAFAAIRDSRIATRQGVGISTPATAVGSQPAVRQSA